MHLMFIQYPLDLVVFCDISKPSVQLDKKDQVDPVCAHIIKHPHEGRSVLVLLPGGDAFVNIDASQLQTIIPYIPLQRFALGS